MANAIRIQFLNEIEDRFTVTVVPKTGWDNAYYEVKGVRGTFILSSPFSDDSKVKTGIISKQFQCGYLYDDVTGIPVDFFVNNLTTFEPDYWVVTVTRNSETLPFFKGFLSQENNRMPLMNRTQPVILIATDGLSTLKNKDFVNEAETSFNGELCDLSYGKRYTPLFYLIQALGKLNLGLNLQCDSNVTNSAMTGRGTDVTYDPLDHVLIDSRIFGEGEGIKSCYDAINIICAAWKCRLYQENGRWYLESLPDRIFAGYRSYSEYEIGAVVDDVFEYTQVANGSTEYINCEIANSLNIKLVEADAMRYLQVPRGSAKITFNYKYPSKWFYNQDFKDSTVLLSPQPADVEEGGAYELDCWLHQLPPYATPGTPTNDAYRFEEFDDFGNPTGSCAAIRGEDDISGSSWLRQGTLFYVDAGNRITISFETGTLTHRIASGIEQPTVARCVLIGDDGNYYTMGNEATQVGSWYLSNSSLTVNSKPLLLTYQDDTDKYDWTTFSVRSSSIPVGGRIEIILQQHDQGSGAEGSKFKNFRINYEQGNDGDFNTAGEGGVDPYEETAVISDSPARPILGGLYRYPAMIDTNTLYYPQWSFYGQFVTKRRFTELMAKVVYSFQKRIYNKIEGTVKGYMFLGDNGNFQAGFLPRYIFKEFNTQMEFMLTGAYSFDLTTGKWRGVFVEVDQDNTPIVFEGGTPAELDLDATHVFDFINS